MGRAQPRCPCFPIGNVLWNHDRRLKGVARHGKACNPGSGVPEKRNARHSTAGGHLALPAQRPRCLASLLYPLSYSPGRRAQGQKGRRGSGEEAHGLWLGRSLERKG